jgi:methyltransferase-like protein
MLKHLLPLLISLNCFSQGSTKETADTSDASKTKILKIYKELLTDTSKFDDLALSYSEDAFSMMNKGILSKMKIEEFDETFAFYGKKLKIGEISAPFETIFG